jgi:hypothetical protein
MDRGIVVSELESATAATGPADLRTRFEPALTAKPATSTQSPEDVLSGILLDLQSANALMAAGLAMNEHGRGADSKFLNDTVAQIQATSSAVGSQIAKSTALRFAPQKEPSANLDDALKLFRESADRTLHSIDSGTKGVIGSAFDKLKEVDKSKVSEAIDNLGRSFDVDDPEKADVTDPEGKALRMLIRNFWEVLEIETSAKFSAVIWKEIQPWVPLLLQDRVEEIKLPNGVELRHVLNAAWLARVRSDDNLQSLNAAVKTLQVRVKNYQEREGG